MSEHEHTKEPWKRANGTYVEDTAIEDSEGWRLACDVDPKNARRIVACVNACAGLSTEALESGALAELLETAKRALNVATTHLPEDRVTVLAAIMLLAKLEGE